MKKIIAGLGFMLTGVLLYISGCIVGASGMPNTNSWETQLGRFWQTVIDNGLMPMFVFGFIFLATGAALALWGVFEKENGGVK